jgi:Zn-dependent peptidase ImmA (M78 family)/transcriptional regulator with XRE-family HTH domain
MEAISKDAEKEALGGRIAAARQRRGLTQDVLADALGIHKTAISKIESGQRKVDSHELAVIAETVGVPVRDLLGLRPTGGLLAVAARIAENAEQGDAAAGLRRIRQLIELDHLLTELGFGDGPNRPSMEMGSLSTSDPRTAGRAMAQQVREMLNMGDDPIGDFPDLIERRFGVDVGLEPLVQGLSGFCVRSGAAALILVNSSLRVGHQRFTTAHELCHQLLEDPQPVVVERDLMESSTADEVRANTFAAYFLMPPKGIKEYLREGSVDERAVTDLMFVFGVSLAALTWHLHELKLISWEEAQRLREIGPRALALRHGRWDTWQAAEGQLELVRSPLRLYERAIDAYVNGRIGIGPVAGLLQRSDEERLRRELAEVGIAPKLEQDVDVSELV